ncbi:MAG: RNA methyltransferase [Pleomorphochaeta sp.]
MKEKQNLNRIQIVLVDTQDAYNIGSVCRAMKTMNINKLAIVSTREYDKNKVKKLSIHAYDIFENARFYNSLEEALSTSVYSVGATRRRGKNRKADCLNPEQLSEKISKIGEGIVSIVFGREDRGLVDNEIRACSQIVTIPTSDEFPSLNLSQAVQIITYSLYNNLKPYPVENTPVTKDRIKIGVDKSISYLDDINFFKRNVDRESISDLLKDVYERALLNESELQRLEKFYFKIDKIVKYKNK